VAVTSRFIDRILPVILSLGLLAGATALLMAQTASGARTKIDVSKLGPQVGQTVPDFKLTDQNGKVWSRASSRSPSYACCPPSTQHRKPISSNR
jgi:hypothetical protein